MTSPAHAGSARAEILARIRAARPQAPPLPVPRDYHAAGTYAGDGLVDLLADRLGDYGANVLRCSPADAPAAIAAALAEAGARRVAIPDGLPEPWAAAAAVPLAESQVSGRAGRAALETADAVVTTVTAAIAQTGTLILDHGPGQGPRELTLIPDLHLAVVAPAGIVAAVPDAIARITPGASLTWVSGPSATSDIELNRVEGVHGPRTLIVVILDDVPLPWERHDDEGTAGPPSLPAGRGGHVPWRSPGRAGIVVCDDARPTGRWSTSPTRPTTPPSKPSRSQLAGTPVTPLNRPPTASCRWERTG